MALTQVDGGLLSPTNGQFYGFKNRFINGSMLVAQYGTSGTISSSNGYYSLDRWQIRNPASTGGTVTYAQVFDSTSGVTKLRLTYASATSSSYFQQKIEAQNITDLWGNQVTFSLYSNDSAVNVSAYSYDSSGTEATLFSNAALTSLGGNRYSYTFTCTTPAGGIRGGNALGMIFQINVKGGATPSNSTNYDYWNCQLEKGSTATSFDYRPYGTELALCQRYYQVWPGTTSSAALINGGFQTTALGYCTVLHILPMRASPTYSIGSSLIFVNLYSTDGTITGIGNQLTTPTSGRVSFNLTGTGTLFTQGQYAWVAGNGTSGSYFAASAEL